MCEKSALFFCLSTKKIQFFFICKNMMKSFQQEEGSACALDVPLISLTTWYVIAIHSETLNFQTLKQLVCVFCFLSFVFFYVEMNWILLAPWRFISPSLFLLWLITWFSSIFAMLFSACDIVLHEWRTISVSWICQDWRMRWI